MSLSSRSRFPCSPLPISLLGAAVTLLAVSSTGPSLASQGDEAMLLAYKFQPGAVRNVPSPLQASPHRGRRRGGFDPADLSRRQPQLQ